MSGSEEGRRKRTRGLSRRDFVLGRLLKLEPPADVDQTRPVKNEADMRPSAIMRYPRTLHDVASADPPHDEGESIPATAARRRTIPVLRPPGAIEESSFLAGCTRCELCIEACPHEAIIQAPSRLREAAGTPILDPDRQPCLMCADYPCIAACEPQVLTHAIPKMMGTARITEHLCLPHHGTPCSACREACPVEQAIVIRQNKPMVDESKCTGCGVCRHVCPAPENAILLMPTFLRPRPRTERKQP